MADHRTARTGAKPSLTTLVALTALALGLPGGDALADKQSSGPGVAEIAYSPFSGPSMPRRKRYSAPPSWRAGS